MSSYSVCILFLIFRSDVYFYVATHVEDDEQRRQTFCYVWQYCMCGM